METRLTGGNLEIAEASVLAEPDARTHHGDSHGWTRLCMKIGEKLPNGHYESEHNGQTLDLV